MRMKLKNESCIISYILFLKKKKKNPMTSKTTLENIVNSY